jgi:hypothetical protein
MTSTLDPVLNVAAKELSGAEKESRPRISYALTRGQRGTEPEPLLDSPAKVPMWWIGLAVVDRSKQSLRARRPGSSARSATSPVKETRE